MKISTTLLTLNTPNKNGRIYTAEVIQKAIDATQNMIPSAPGSVPLTAEMPQGINVDLEKVCGMVTNMRIEGDRLVGDVSVIDRAKNVFPDLESALLNGDLAVRPTGIGVFDKQQKISEYTLICFAVTNDPA